MINRCLSCTCHQRLVFLKHLGKCGQRYYCAFLMGHFVFCIHEKFEINALGTYVHMKGPACRRAPPPRQHFQQFLCSVAYPLTSSTACSNFMDDHCTRQDEISRGGTCSVQTTALQTQIIRFLSFHRLFLLRLSIFLVLNQPACHLKSAGLHLSVCSSPETSHELLRQQPHNLHKHRCFRRLSD